MPRTRPRKHPVTPGVPTPARELYGTMLLERGMAKGSARRVRSDVEKGAEPARRHARRRCSRGKVGRFRQGANALRPRPSRSRRMPIRSDLRFAHARAGWWQRKARAEADVRPRGRPRDEVRGIGAGVGGRARRRDRRRTHRTKARGQAGGRRVGCPSALGGDEVAVSPWINGEPAAHSPARRPIAAERRSSSIFAPSSAPAIAQPASPTDDADLDRMSDFDLVGGEVSPLGAGRPITIAWMKGVAVALTRSPLAIGRASRRSRSCSTTAAT